MGFRLVSVVAGSLLFAATAHAQGTLPNSLTKMDTDRDGKLSPSEWAADRPDVLKRLDKDKSGGISKEEASAYYQRFGAADDKKTISRINTIMKSDSDGDGSVTLAELMAAANAEFARRDKDKDGFITPADTGK